MPTASKTKQIMSEMRKDGRLATHTKPTCRPITQITSRADRGSESSSLDNDVVGLAGEPPSSSDDVGCGWPSTHDRMTMEYRSPAETMVRER